MDCWDILEIKPTVDLSLIKKAYAIKLKYHHPEEDPKGFQAVREAYVLAQKLAKTLSLENEENTASINVLDKNLSHFPDNSQLLNQRLEAFNQKLQSIYDNFFIRIDVKSWEKLLNDDLMWDIHTRTLMNQQIINFLMDHYHIPKSVWYLLNSTFNWHNNKEHLYSTFPQHFINYIFWQLKHVEKLRYCYFQNDQQIDFDKYLEHRENAYISLQEKDFKNAIYYIECATRIYPTDPDLLCIKAEYYFLKKKKFKSTSMFKTATNIYPDDIYIYSYQVHMLLKHDKTSKVIRIFRTAFPLIMKTPLNPKANDALQQIASELNIALKNDSNNLRLRNTLKKIYEIVGDTQGKDELKVSFFIFISICFRLLMPILFIALTALIPAIIFLVIL
ncbi:MAG: hypothetical protein CVU84_14330 [Firmicutes bacterium HGW-Firmicutes-1]|jgi:hypothetical protein|nr:MAG: hypothetical protein CVU84_14330 [Firmicutes bacterium HGW-Firmicutes-1]